MIADSRPNQSHEPVDELTDDVAHAADEVAEILDAAQRKVTKEAEARPYTVAAVALGAGYGLGGGIPSWALRMVAGPVARAAVAALVVPGVTSLLAGEPEERDRPDTRGTDRDPVGSSL